MNSYYIPEFKIFQSTSFYPIDIFCINLHPNQQISLFTVQTIFQLKIIVLSDISKASRKRGKCKKRKSPTRRGKKQFLFHFFQYLYVGILKSNKSIKTTISVPWSKEEKSTTIIFDVTPVYKSVKFNVDRYPQLLFAMLIESFIECRILYS